MNKTTSGTAIDTTDAITTTDAIVETIETVELRFGLPSGIYILYKDIIYRKEYKETYKVIDHSYTIVFYHNILW